MIVSKPKLNSSLSTNDPNFYVSGVSSSNVTSIGSDAHSRNNIYAVEHDGKKVQGENTQRKIVFHTPTPLPVDVRIVNKHDSEQTYAESGQENIKFDHHQPTSGLEYSQTLWSHPTEPQSESLGTLGSHPAEPQSESLQVEPEISSYTYYEIPSLEGFSESSSNIHYKVQGFPSKTPVSPSVSQEVPVINKFKLAAPNAQYVNSFKDANSNQDTTNLQKPAYDRSVKYKPVPDPQPKVREELAYYQEHMPDQAAHNIFISGPQRKYNLFRTPQKKVEKGIFDVSNFLTEYSVSY